MNKLKKISIIIVSVILCLTILCQTVTAAFLSPDDAGDVYIKDIKLIYANSIDEAKTQLPKEYKLLESNINEGTGKKGVYICYSTTKDPEEAITDIKVMHESGGFERTDFKASLNDAIDGVYGLAKEMTTAVNEFVQNYKDGVPAAVYAKEALDFFKYDTDTLLGDFMISGVGTYEDYGRMILMCHEDILNPILSLLTLGVQQNPGENWIDRLADVDPDAYDSSMDANYRERATKIRPILQQFNDVYCYVMGYGKYTYTYDDLTDENDKELFTTMAENKDLFTVMQTILRSYGVGTNTSSEWANWATAEDMFTIGLNSTLNMYESYALLDCLTPGQEIMLRLTGPYNLIIGTQNSADVLAEARKTISESLGTEDRIPIWDGVNLDIFEQEVGLTDAAQRSIAAGKQYDIFTKDVDGLAQRHRDTAAIVSSCFTIASCAVLVTKCALVLAPKFFQVVGCYAIANAITAFASAAIVTTIMTISGILFTLGGIVCTIVITFFLEDIIAWMLKEEYDRTSIPKYMVDEVINKEGISTYTYYQRVDNVKTDKELKLDTGDNESGADINVNKGYRWMALYTSNKPTVGNPIKEGFLVVDQSGLDREGYVPLTMFGEVVACNLNSYADKNSSKYPSLYLHYPQDRVTPVESEKIYISHVRVESGIHEDEAKKKLTDKGFIPLNHDFGCKEGESTFVGYKLTANANDAVRDIRLLYNCNSSNIYFGDLNYGSIGTIGNYTVMVSSTSSNPAPPILHLAVFHKTYIPEASLGYEPVNEFSGGLAQTLGRTDYRLYFMPETTFTEGPDYLAGIKTDIYYYNTFCALPYYIYEKQYFDQTDMFDNNVDNYRAYKTQNYKEQFFDFGSQTYFYFERLKSNYANLSDNYMNIGYKYTTTKNPYRAIYGIGANKRNGLDRFNDSVKYADEGFVLAAAELSYNSEFYMGGGKFPYAAYKNENEFGFSYTYQNTHYSSKNSPGKADAWWQDLVKQNHYDTIHSRDYVFNQDITQVFYNDDMNALYLSGYQSDRTPLTAEDIIISSERLEQVDPEKDLLLGSDSALASKVTVEKALEEGKYPSNFTPVTSMIGDSAEATNITPSNGEAYVGYYGDTLQHTDIYVTLYDEVYMYFRNEKTEKGKAVAQSNPKEGKYITDIDIASREEIRENYNQTNKEGDEILCENISKATVENSLLSKGATTTYRTHINTNFSKDDAFANANYTYLGIKRSDSSNDAITDIKLYVAEKGERPEEDYYRKITYNGKTFDVLYKLVGRVSLTEQGNKSPEDCKKERQVYLYISRNPALGDPITDIRMADLESYDDFEPVLTMDNKHFNTLATDSSNSIFFDSQYLIHGNHISFKRDGIDKPYVQDVKYIVHDTGSEHVDAKAMAKLIEMGYYDVINQDMNAGTAGKYIYMGMKRTADKNDAVYDLIATTEYEKNPPLTTGNYTLVSNDDLNKKTIIGKYIYLYQSKTKDIYNSSPLTDLKAVNEEYKKPDEITGGCDSDVSDDPIVVEGGIGVGDIVYKEHYVMNQNAEKQDLNQGAGGEYIYLVMTREVTFENDLFYLGSIFGTGSVIVIGLFLFAATGAIIYSKHKKKREEANTGKENAEDEITEAV